MGEREDKFVPEWNDSLTWLANIKVLFDFIVANMKRTYDEYQDLGLTGARENQSYVQKILSDAQGHHNNNQVIATQALQNAVETANLVGKQAVNHQALAVDRQWNVDEVAHLISHTPIVKDAIAAIIVDALTKK